MSLHPGLDPQEVPAGSDITSYRREEKKRRTDAARRANPLGQAEPGVPSSLQGAPFARRSEATGGDGLALAERRRRAGTGERAGAAGPWSRRWGAGDDGRRAPPPPAGTFRPLLAPPICHTFFVFLKNLPEDSLHSDFSTLYVCEAFLLYFPLTFVLSRPLPTSTSGSANAPFGNC